MDKFYCNNEIVDTFKPFHIDQLRIFYKLLHEYRKEMKFSSDSCEDDTIYIHRDIIKTLFKKSKISFKDELQLILKIPNKIIRVSNDGNRIGFMNVFDFLDYDFITEEYAIKFSEEIIPLLKNESNINFSIMLLDELFLLSSKYSVRLFELCSRFRNQGVYKMKIEAFKRYFDVPSKYRMSEIDKYVLNKSIEEINKNTSFDVSISKVKKGNKVTHITFKIETKENNKKLFNSEKKEIINTENKEDITENNDLGFNKDWD